MKNLVIAIVCFIIAVFCIANMSWGEERKDDDPVQIANLMLLGVGKATFAAPSGTTWFVLMPSSTDYVLMPSSTDKVKKPGH